MYVHTPTQSLLIKAGDPLAVREVLPDQSRLVDLPDGHNLQVKWTLESAKILNNLGIVVPSPIKSFYRFPRPPHYQLLNHQVEMAAFHTLNDKCFNLSEMGTGKTAACLWATDFMMEVGAIKRALILCPLSSMKKTWADDIFDVLPHRTCSIVHGTPERKKKNLSLPVDFYIMNHDGIDIEYLAVEIRKREDIGLIIFDEADVLINSNTDKYRFLKWVMEPKQRLWLITGTPTPNSPTDAWALSKLICPSLSPKYFSHFQREIMVPHAWKPHQWEPKPGAHQRAYEILQPAIRYLKKDNLDLPPVIGPRSIECDLSTEQKAAVKQMAAEMVAFAKTNKITAVNGADKIVKLRQILCGSVKDPATGQYHHLDCGPRIRELRRQISRAQGKALVIVPFKGILQLLEQELPKPDERYKLPGFSVEILNGDVSAGERARRIERFKTQPDPHVLACHPAVMSHGLNFTEADYTIFYAPIDSNRQYMQVIERMNRLGQKRTMYILRMMAHPIEAPIYKRVDERGSMQDSILELYNAVINGTEDEL